MSPNDVYKSSITIIKEALGKGDLGEAAKAWFKLSEEARGELWVAPSKGGPFSTRERIIMQSYDFRTAFIPRGELKARLSRMFHNMRQSHGEGVVYWVPAGDLITIKEAVAFIEESLNSEF